MPVVLAVKTWIVYVPAVASVALNPVLAANPPVLAICAPDGLFSTAPKAGDVLGVVPVATRATLTASPVVP